MKTKKFSKKLGLKKATVANLSDLRMQTLQGGAPLTSYMDPKLCGTQCPTGVCCPIFETLDGETFECCQAQATIDADCNTTMN